MQRILQKNIYSKMTLQKFGKFNFSERDGSGFMKKMILDCQNLYSVTYIDFYLLKPPISGLVSQKTHILWISSRHIPNKYVLRKSLTPFFSISIFGGYLGFWSPKCTCVSCVKNIILKSSVWSFMLERYIVHILSSSSLHSHVIISSL